MKLNILFVLLLSINTLSYQHNSDTCRSVIDLSGQWQFSTDTGNVGLQQKWFAKDLTDVINLPGTTDSNHKGFLNSDTTTMHLNRVYKYEGAAWYRKKINVPELFKNKHFELILERTKSTKIWIDERFIGESHILQSPQHFDLTGYLSTGEHTITICVNNDLKLTLYGNVHIYSDDTQTNWNGILGKILIEASSKTYISDLKIYPDINNKKLQLQLSVVNGLNIENADIELQLNRLWKGEDKKLYTSTKTVHCDSIINIEYCLDDEMILWDDYQQPLYQLTAVMINSSFRDSKTTSFGMRKFAANGKQFTINGRTTFLRGKHDACVFPLTGHPPMEVEGWKKVFENAKSYGINHYRFHSYCPPEAAFDAADELGIFLQPELPFWGGLENDTIASMLRDEGIAMLKSFANHPSFVMFGAGNEIWSGHDRVEKITQVLKKYNPGILYSTGANNNIGYAGPGECSDFHIAARTPYEHDTTLTHTRLTHAFADSRDGGILNTQYPSTLMNYDYVVSAINVPLISHEIGQYQVYPDYDEIKKYTGVLRAWNLEIFRNRLLKSGMIAQNKEFQKASGAWSAICYKAEMETALRTKQLAGFQLLDLQDYPGQGTALVGILDAFMDSKEVISRESWLQSCNDIVLLLEFPKYCWQTNEVFNAELKIANYSNKIISDDVEWKLQNEEGEIYNNGYFSIIEIKNGGLTGISKISTPLNYSSRAEKLTINLKLKGNGYSNSYPIWIYPALQPDINPDGVIITDELDEIIIAELESGSKVLLLPNAESVKSKSVEGLFPPDFWNYGMFKGISEYVKKPVSPGTLGILTNPAHPIFNNFPTESHTNWQWFSIIKASSPVILNNTPDNYKPIVQVIDNLERNAKLGLIFEFAVGKGKLLICTSRLNEILSKPEGLNLYQSILNYMRSDDFAPALQVDKEFLSELFQ
jgi:hypothetical protein